MATPPPPKPPPAPSPESNPLDAYQTVADTLGGPSLRIKDNLIQAAAVFACIGLGALAGFVGWGVVGAVIGGVSGMFLGTLVSGFVIMILGWIRAAERLKNRPK